MTVSILEAFKNVIKDKDFMPNYTVLVVMSFCCGLLYFAFSAKNMNVLIPLSILALLATIYAEGYHLHYFKVLIKDDEPKMPEWNDFGKYYLTGLKYAAAVIILTFVLCAIILPFIIMAIALTSVSKFLGLFILMLIVMIGLILEVFLFLCIPSFPCTFTDSEENIFSLLNIKKLFGYFSVNYFITLFAICLLATINGLLSIATTVDYKYSLLYIIPLMLAPFIRLGTDNLIAQTYLANKNGEHGSVVKMCILLLILLFIMFVHTILLIILAIKQ